MNSGSRLPLLYHSFVPRPPVGAPPPPPPPQDPRSQVSRQHAVNLHAQMPWLNHPPPLLQIPTMNPGNIHGRPPPPNQQQHASVPRSNGTVQMHSSKPPNKRPRTESGQAPATVTSPTKRSSNSIKTDVQSSQINDQLGRAVLKLADASKRNHSHASVSPPGASPPPSFEAPNDEMVNKLTTEIKTLNNTIRKLEKEHASDSKDTKKTLEIMVADNEGLKAETTRLNEHLANERKDHQVALGELEKLKSLFEDARNELTQMKQEFKVSNGPGGNTGTTSPTGQQISGYKLKNDELNKKLVDSKAENDKLQKILSATKTDNEKLQSELKAAKLEMGTLKKNLDDAKNELKNIGGLYDARFEQARNVLEKENATLKEQNQKMESEVATLIASVQDLKKDLNSEHQRAENLSKQHDDAKEKLSQSEANFVGIRERYDKYKGTYSQLLKDKTAADEKLKIQTDGALIMQRLMKEKDAKYDALEKATKEEKATMEEHIDALKQQRQDLHDRIETISAEFQSIRQLWPAIATDAKNVQSSSKETIGATGREIMNAVTTFVRRLQSQNADQQKVIDELQRQQQMGNVELQAKFELIQHLQQLVRANSIEIGQFKQNEALSKEKLQTLEQYNCQLRDQIEQKSNQLLQLERAMQDETRRLRGQIEQKNIEIGRIQMHRGVASNNQTVAASAKIGELEAKYEEMQEMRMLSETKAANFEVQLKEKNKQLTASQKYSTELEQHLAKAEQKLSETEKQLAEKNKHLDESRSMLEKATHLDKQLAEKDKELFELHSRLDEVADLDKQLAEKDKELVELHSKLMELDALKGELKAKAEVMAVLHQQLDEWKQKDDSKNVFKSAKVEGEPSRPPSTIMDADWKKKLAEKDTQIVRLKSQLEAEAQKLRDAVETSGREKMKYMDQRNDAEKRCLSLESQTIQDLETLRRSLNIMKEEKEKADRTACDVTSRIGKLAMELADIQNRINQVINRYDVRAEMKAELKHIHGMLATAFNQ